MLDHVDEVALLFPAAASHQVDWQAFSTMSEAGCIRMRCDARDFAEVLPVMLAHESSPHIASRLFEVLRPQMLPAGLGKPDDKHVLQRMQSMSICTAFLVAALHLHLCHSAHHVTHCIATSCIRILAAFYSSASDSSMWNALPAATRSSQMAPQLMTQPLTTP